MLSHIILGVLIPFFGTTAGAALVFLLKKEMSPALSRVLNGFAAGVMLAASVWSLLIPSIEGSAKYGAAAPAVPVLGFFSGIFCLLLLDKLVLKLYEGGKGYLGLSRNNFLMSFAVALHNLPEGIAVGVIFAGALADGGSSLLTAAFALSVGIAVQNLPEGAIISCPLYAGGMSKPKAFALGTLSGAIEPLGAALAIAAVGLATGLLPFLLSFTAGAMIFVTVKNLIPEIADKDSGLLSMTFFSLGFCLMMTLDTAL